MPAVLVWCGDNRVMLYWLVPQLPFQALKTRSQTAQALLFCLCTSAADSQDLQDETCSCLPVVCTIAIPVLHALFWNSWAPVFSWQWLWCLSMAYSSSATICPAPSVLERAGLTLQQYSANPNHTTPFSTQLRLSEVSWFRILVGISWCLQPNKLAVHDKRGH